MKARIVEIKRFAVHDGDGIRTTVFFKGCPLKCVWCHNPESISFAPQLAYYEKQCVACGECVEACALGAQKIVCGEHRFERKICTGCGKCEASCLGDALKVFGREMTVEELLPLVLEDREFFETSDGGVTLSGGECLMQADFCGELLKRLKEKDIHTAVDTCGFVSKAALDKVMPYTDVFLYDLKAMDVAVHIRCTGKPNGVILENLRYLDGCGKPVEIRIPYVPGMNDHQIEKMAAFLKLRRNIIRVRVLPYHNYAGSKYRALDMENTLPAVLPEKEKIRAAEECLKKHGLPVAAAEI